MISTTLLTPWRPQCPRTRPPWKTSGCQKCYGRSCWGSFHSLQKIGAAEGRGSSTGSTITSLTPWRSPWWPGYGHAQGLSFCLLTASPCNPLDYYFVESTSDFLKAYMVAPFANITRKENTFAWSYYRQGRGWLHLFFILFFIFDNFIFECVREKLFCPDLSWRPCIQGLFWNFCRQIMIYWQR